jgi:hypothetical protein
MVTQLIEAQKADLLWIGYALAAEVMKPEDQAWLQRRFTMFHEILSDSPVYQEVFGKGKWKILPRV